MHVPLQVRPSTGSYFVQRPAKPFPLADAEPIDSIDTPDDEEEPMIPATEEKMMPPEETAAVNIGVDPGR